MRINIAQINEEDGLNVQHLYPEGEPSLSGNESRLAGRSELDLQASRAGQEVSLVGRVTARVEFECDRCLQPVAVRVEPSFDLLYLPPLGVGQEHELGEDDLAIGFYQDETIDVDDLVREQIELALPMSRLCREACRGLCPDCGANLNDGDCTCKDEEIDPRWAALKELKTNH